MPQFRHRFLSTLLQWSRDFLVYFEKNVVRSAQDYLTSDPLITIRFDQRTVSLNVLLTYRRRKTSVRFVQEQHSHRIVFNCTCQESSCVHAAAACLLLWWVETVDPSEMDEYQLSVRRALSQVFREDLPAPSSIPPALSVDLTDSANGFQFAVRDPVGALVRDLSRHLGPWMYHGSLYGEKTSAIYGWEDVPKVLQDLASSDYMHLKSSEEAFSRYLNEGLARYPLHFQIAGGGRRPVQWRPEATVEPVVCFWRTPSSCEIQRRYSYQDAYIGNLRRWADWLFRPETGELFLAPRNSFFPVYEALVELTPKQKPQSWNKRVPLDVASISLRSFERVTQAVFDFGVLSSFQCEVTGERLQQVHQQLIYAADGRHGHHLAIQHVVYSPETVRVVITQVTNGETRGFRLALESQVGTSWGPCSSRAFDWVVPVWGGKKARVMQRKFAARLCAQMSPSLSEAEIAELMVQCGYSDSGETDRLQSEAVAAVQAWTQGVWRLIMESDVPVLSQVPFRAELELLQVLLGIIPDQVFEQAPIEPVFFLSAQQAESLIEPLLRQLVTRQISVVFEDQVLALGVWDCELEVKEKPGSDWFELHPTIRCDGRRVGLSALTEGAFAGLVLTKDGWRLVDGPARVYLQALETIQPAKQKKRRVVVEIPRVQILDWLALRQQGITLTLPPAQEAMLARLLGFERLTIPQIPSAFTGELRPYQRDGYGWLSFIYESGLGGCLADDMRLGKTLQVLTLIAAIQEGIVRRGTISGPHLLVVPTSAVSVWEDHARRFFRDMRLTRYLGPERKAEWQDGEIVLTTYGVLARDIEILAQKQFHLCAFDEGQDVKNLLSERASATRRIQAACKIPTTGTPMENHLGEYYAMMDLAVPGLLGPYATFKRSMAKVDSPYMSTMLNRAKPLVLRRLLSEVEGLPPMTENEVVLELSPEQKQYYQRIVTAVRREVDEAFDTLSAGQATMQALTGLLRLRQICLSPGLVQSEWTGKSPKLDFLAEQVQTITAEGHSILVFSSFTKFLDLAQEVVGRLGVPCYRFDGSLSERARSRVHSEFNAEARPSVFFLSLKAGGRALDLRKANYVFILDPWWNPQVERQAAQRVNGVGQTKAMFLTRIIMQHSIEEKIGVLKQEKMTLFDSVMEGSTRQVGRAVLTRAELDHLFSFTP